MRTERAVFERTEGGGDVRTIFAEERLVSWRAGQSRLLHGFTSSTEGLSSEPALCAGPDEAYEVPAVSQRTKYTLVQLEVPLGRRGGMRLLQLEVPDHQVGLLKQVLSGLPLRAPLASAGL